MLIFKGYNSQGRNMDLLNYLEGRMLPLWVCLSAHCINFSRWTSRSLAPAKYSTLLRSAGRPLVIARRGHFRKGLAHGSNC
jgi:hypothetical protein